MHIKTVTLLRNFFHLVCMMVLICQQRFLFNVFFTFFIFSIENAFFNVLYSCNGSTFFTSMMMMTTTTMMLLMMMMIMKMIMKMKSCLFIGDRSIGFYTTRDEMSEVVSRC